MASMRQLFPSYNPQVKTKRNFIKENIRNARGCNNQCITEKKESIIHKSTLNKSYDPQKVRSIKFKSETDLRRPVIKCNMKIVNRANSSFLNHGNQQYTSLDRSRNESRKKSTASMGKSNYGRENNSQNPDAVTQNKHYHKLSHEKEESCKKEQNKSLDLSSYKKGEVPRYLQERLTRLMKEDEEKKEREKLVEKLGLNDPRCPPGHMLMPPEQLKEELTTFCNQYELLIGELNAMPITRESFRIRNRKIEIEKELKRLDDKIHLYRNGKVFMKIPE